MWSKIEKYLFGRVSRNIAFWLLFTLFHYSGRGSSYYLYAVLFFVLILSYALPCYFNNIILIPKLLLKRKYLRFTLAFILLLAVTSAISYYVTKTSNRLFPELNYMGAQKDVALPYHAFPSMLMFIMFAAAKFTTDAFQNQHKLETLESQRVLSELESLKAQINPHFLFNSLNTIYGLAKRNDEQTAEAVMKLSDILRYVLYESNVSSISIKKEISFLNHFVDFVKLRIQRATITFNIDADIKEQQIAPLLLLPFLENAIKHGPGKHIQNSWIFIDVSLKNNSFSFQCSNSNRNKGKIMSTANNSSGIGLKNVKRRLNLLYGDRHTLEIVDNEKEFSARLQLELQ